MFIFKIKTFTSEDEVVMCQLNNELDVNEMLQHENIVQYYGAYLDEDIKKNIDLIFEFCDTTLKAECQEALEHGQSSMDQTTPQVFLVFSKVIQ